MKRVNNLYCRIPEYQNLCLAFIKAARGKRSREDVRFFYRHFHENIAAIQQQLLNHRPDIGHYRFFEVFDPKRRSICAALFPERVLHHAIMNLCEPVLERYAINESYACRKGKGNRKALNRAWRFSRQFSCYLKLDIRKYFDSIDHDILMESLSRRFKDMELMDLFQKILDTYHTRPGKGLPIGNLISQHAANFYLGRYDHWIKEQRRLKGYVRYMDDFILFGDSRDFLKTELVETQTWLQRELNLELKPNIQLNRCIRGIPFLGFRVFPQTIRLSPRSRKRFVNKCRICMNKWRDGEWDEAEVGRRMRSAVEFTRSGHSLEFRRRVIARYGISS